MKNAQTPDIQDTPAGAVVTVKVVPGASRNRIAGVLGGAIRVSVAAPPEKGRANQAVAETLARFLNLPLRSVTLLRGQTAPRKQFLLAGIDAQDVRHRLASKED